MKVGRNVWFEEIFSRKTINMLRVQNTTVIEREVKKSILDSQLAEKKLVNLTKNCRNINYSSGNISNWISSNIPSYLYAGVFNFKKHI